MEQVYDQKKWYRVTVDLKMMRALTQRQDARPMRDMVLWLAFMACFAGLVIAFRESWSSALFLLCYGILYGSASASREHETGHMTAFKTKRWNTLFHHIASFMLLRERFARLNGHHAHHKHTIHTEKDPEIVTPNPPKILAMTLNLLQIQKTAVALRSIGLHAFGLLAPGDVGMLFEKVPRAVRTTSQAWLGLIVLSVVTAIYLQSWLPVVLVGPLPTMFGGTLQHVFATTQHTGLASNVFEHRLNTRTIYFGPIMRFIYSNMNYHLEHHLFPNVPYYNLPKLHELIKDQCPPAYSGLGMTLLHVIMALARQLREPGFFVQREFPPVSQ